MPSDRLTAALDTAARVALDIAGKEEALAMLVLVDCPTDAGAETMLCALVTDSAAEQARLARLLVLAHEPRVAVHVMEGWTSARDLSPADRDDPDYGPLLRGDLRPSQLPPEKRGEMLIVYGETPEGESEHRMWRITPQPDGTRALAAIDMRDVTPTSRFVPLFVVDDILRRVDATDAGRAAQADFDPGEAKARTRRLVLEMLERGGGTSSPAHEAAIRAAHAKFGR